MHPLTGTHAHYQYPHNKPTSPSPAAVIVGIVQQLASCEAMWMASGGYVMPFESTTNDGVLMGLTGTSPLFPSLSLIQGYRKGWTIIYLPSTRFYPYAT